MLGNSHGSGAFVSALSMTAPKSPAGEILRRALKLGLLCATAALFAFWWASSDGRRPGLWGKAPAANCGGFGRGGSFCSAGTTQDRAPDPMRDCQSLGRGGWICSETSRK